ncbi:MAG TPA: PorP/SprF family type IX secretion system membrane protein [Bacteroidia bacterium]|nr:PorP/SprF family type IX secretion system membrane protein [Bacteroidia bacterium]
MRTFLHKVLFAVLLFSGGVLFAQDVHFSQFYSTPLQVNPAMTGVYDGKLRFTNNYRSQWSSLGKGYKTIHTSLDFPVGKTDVKNNYFGVGAMVYQDKAGEAGFTSTIIEGSLSYVTAMDDIGDHYFSIGFQGGLNQNSLDISKTTWDSQWNGDTYDPSLPSFENIQLQQFAYLDFNAGMMYFYVPDGNNSLALGASMSHVGSPNVSFILRQEAPLRKKYTFHGSGDLSMNKENQTWLQPRFLVSVQGKQKEIVAGAFLKNKVQFKSRYTNYKKEAYFIFGGFYRLKDAAIFTARFEYNTVGLGISYDLNTSSLSNLAGSANAFEINLSYVMYVKRGERAKNFNKMPRFL